MRKPTPKPVSRKAEHTYKLSPSSINLMLECPRCPYKKLIK